MDFRDEFFGSAAQQTVSRRARDAWMIARDDPRFAYNGRIVAATGYSGPETAGHLASLARLQGSTTCHFLPKNRAAAVRQDVESEGLATNVWEFCKGGDTAYDAARAILAAHILPADISVLTLGPETAPSVVAGLAATAGDCGVLVMAGRVMRGLDVPGLTLAGVDGNGEVVASAWGYRCYHPQSAFSDHAFWGGLTCRPDRRGQKIALLLGALSIVRLREEMQVQGFCTGIAGDNSASFRLCEKLGVLPSDEIGLGVTDPEMFRGATLTK